MAVTAGGQPALREHAERIGLAHEVEDPVKVRVGLGLGPALRVADLFDVVDACEDVGLDSLWFTERIAGDVGSPMVMMAAVAGRTRRLRFGTSAMILPGRDPIRVAKDVATLDVVSGGRVIPVFGLVAPRSGDRRLLRVPHGAAGRWADEALGLMRRLWTEDAVDHQGEWFSVSGLTLGPRPVQSPHPDMWTGGHSPAATARAGRLADGWLPSFVPPDDYGALARQVLDAAAATGRRWDLGHLGMVVPYVPPGRGDEADGVLDAVARRVADRDPASVVVLDAEALSERIEAYVGAGASKFVALPLVAPHDWVEEVARLHTTVTQPLQALALPG